MRHLLVCALAALALPAAAHACMNAVVLETDEVRRLVSRAEKALERGKPVEVLRLLDDDDNEMDIDRRLRRRVDLLVAVAHTRLGRQARALPTLRKLQQGDPQNPLLVARVAEALAGTPDGAKEALLLLGDLEKRDLVPDAEAWATLAFLRETAGDAPARERALNRCRAIARLPEVCGARPAAAKETPATGRRRRSLKSGGGQGELLGPVL